MGTYLPDSDPGEVLRLGRGEERATRRRSIISSRSPMTMNRDREEKEILRSFDRGEWRSVPNLKREKRRLARAAKATFRKDRRLNIRISSKNLEAIQKRALEEGLPYQTLISSLLHKFASGRLKVA